MSKFLHLLLLLFISHGFLWAQTKVSTPAENNSIILSKSGTQSNVISFSLSEFYVDEILTEKGLAYNVSAANGTNILKPTAPDLPKFSVSLIIPNDGGLNIKIKSTEYIEFNDYLIVPSKGNLYRDINPDNVLMVFGDTYEENKYFPGKLAVLDKPYSLRDFRGQCVHIFPFQYNPVTKKLRVYYKMNIELKPQNVVNQQYTSILRPDKRLVNDFIEIYKKHFLNYDEYKGLKYTPIEEQGSMLVISYGSFMNAMQPFVDWKNTIGIKTTMVDVATIGNNPTSIKSYIQAVYDTTNLTYVLLVGDAAQVSTNTVNGYHSDNAYGYLSGSDSYSEVFIGRFSAENVAHVETQVERTINYERYPNTQIDIFNQAIGIASLEGPGHNNLLDYEHLRVIRDSLLNYYYSFVNEFYEGSQGGLDMTGDPTPAMISADLNSGISLINYTGHGWDEGWGTSGFSSADVVNLTNTKILPFIWSVACVNGNFVGGTCFGEAWLRATHNSQPSGAVAALMSTVNQSWNPPMCAQLEMNNILTESLGNNIKRTFGGLSINGCMKMNDDYGTAGAEMTDTWTIFGDPSLMVRTDNPQMLTVTHNPVVFIGESNFLVNCNHDGALVCLTINKNIISTAYISGGSAMLSFPPLTTLDTIVVAVTGYNYIPYIGEVLIVPPSGPYVIYSTHTVNDTAGNNNNQADFNENILLNVELKNVGINDADSVWALVTTASPHAVVSQNQNYWGDMLPSATQLISNAFNIQISDSIPDQQAVVFNLNAHDKNSNTWQSSFIIKPNAPLFAAANISFDDSAGNGNGIIDPGETVIISIPTTNSGSAAINNTTATITSTSPYLTLNTAVHNFSNFTPASSQSAVFSITADSLTPNETQASIIYTVNAGAYSIVKTFDFFIGLLPDFLMSDSVAYVCDAYFYDSNGPSANYVNNENYVMTFYPPTYYPQNEAHLKVEFLEFDVEENDWYGGCWDELFIYNGPTANAPLIGSYCGTNNPPVMVSTHPTGALTFRFQSDDYVDMGGWKAKLSCVVTTATEQNETELPSFSVFPNPTENTIHISLNHIVDNYSLMLYDAKASLILTENGYCNGSCEKSLGIGHLKQGIYILKIKTPEFIKVEKIIKY